MFFRTLILFLSVSAIELFAKPTENQYFGTRQKILESITLENTPSDTITKPKWLAKKANYNPERSRKFKLHHTKLEVSFDWKKQYLYGTATLTLQPHFYAQNEVVLDAKSFEIQEIALGTEKLKYEYDGEFLKVILPRKMEKTEKIDLKIRYIAKPNERKAKGSAAILSDKGLYFINPEGKEPNKPKQIWTQGETESSSCWFPTFDSPNTKTTQEIYITVDKQYVTLSNGKLISSTENKNGTRTDYWKQEKPHSPYLFMMAVGEYAVVKDEWRGKEVNYYVEPAYQPHAKKIFGNTPEMLEFFSNKLDYEFAWDKYSQVVVRDYVSGAMENTSASVFMEQLQVDSRQLLDEHWDKIIAHELFHQWFGDVVTCESWANLPLNESFANLSEYLWLEHKYGQNDADEARYEDLKDYLEEAENKREPLIRYYYADKEEMFDNHSYAKGALILTMLRKYIGEEAFFKSLNVYLRKNEYKNAEIHQLRLAFEEVTGEDLNWFFDQWFLQGGHPEIEITEKYENGELVLTVKQKQDEQFSPIYRLPLYVDIVAKGSKLRHYITVSKKEEIFRFKTEQPEVVIFDAESQVAGTIEHTKTWQNYFAQFNHSDLLIPKMQALANLKDEMNREPEVQKLFVKALSDPFRQIRQEAAGAFREYAGLDQQDIGKILAEMAVNDKNSLVRATAISALAGMGEKYQSLFEQTMKDSSYAVLVSSLYSYHNSGAAEKVLAKLTDYEALNNMGVVVTLGEFYTYYKVASKSDWFIQKLGGKNGYELNFLMNHFGQYLLTQPKEEQEKGANYFEKIFLAHPSGNTRIEAYRNLATLKIDKLKERLKKLKAQEKDVKVLGTLELFGS